MSCFPTFFISHCLLSLFPYPELVTLKEKLCACFLYRWFDSCDASHHSLPYCSLPISLSCNAHSINQPLCDTTKDSIFLIPDPNKWVGCKISLFFPIFLPASLYSRLPMRYDTVYEMAVLGVTHHPTFSHFILPRCE